MAESKLSASAPEFVPVSHSSRKRQQRVALSQQRVAPTKMKCWPEAKKGWRLPGGVSLTKLGCRIRDLLASKTDALGSKPGLEWAELCKAYQATHKTKLTAASFGFHRPESLLGTLADLGEVELWYTFDFVGGVWLPDTPKQTKDKQTWGGTTVTSYKTLNPDIAWWECFTKDDADWIPDCALGSYGGHKDIAARSPPLVAAPRLPQSPETTDADPGTWALNVQSLSGEVTRVYVHNLNTVQDLLRKYERILGLLPGQAKGVLNGVELGSDMLVAELSDTAVDVLVAPPEIKWRVGILAHVTEISQVVTTGGACLVGGEIVKINAIEDDMVDVAVWDPEHNQDAEGFEGFSDTAHGVPLMCLVAARRPPTRPVQVVPRHEGASPNAVSFETPGVCEQRCTMCSEQPSRRDIGFCSPGSLITVKVTDGGGGLDWVASSPAGLQASQMVIDSWSGNTYAGNLMAQYGVGPLLNQRKVGPFDARFQELLVGGRRVALPSNPGEAARVLSEVRALAFAAGLLPGCVLIPAAFLPGFSQGQRVRRPVTGREGVINEYGRGSRPYRMEAQEWSAPPHELEPVTVAAE